MLVHDDIPKVNWKKAVIQQVIMEKDGLISTVNIRTVNGVTNCLITKLYPLEVTASDVKSFSDTNPDSVTSLVSAVSLQLTTSEQPAHSVTRNAATRARQQLSEWYNILCGPPEDVKSCWTIM